MEAFELEKLVWDDGDFERMGWHDAHVWSAMANPDDFELLLDLDYIFKWVHPKDGETHFRFWVAPVTMVFANVHDVRIDLTSSQGIIEIANLHRENPSLVPNGTLTEFRYRFECQEGEISLTATGYTLFVRRKPRLQKQQGIGLMERGGIGFGRDLMG